MKRIVCVMATLAMALPSLAGAHVSVRPRQSAPGSEERYIVRVPTEGAVATMSVRLEIPNGVAVLDVERFDGGTSDVEKKDARVVAITWKKEIKPKEVAEFFFRAKNPDTATDLTWRAHQHFADGTVADWVGIAGARRPAPVTTLAAGPAPAATSAGTGQAGDAAAVETWLKGYDAAFNAKNLDALATFYHPDATIYEGGGINNGWADYRDHHLGPELKQFQKLQFARSDTKVVLLPGGQSAYAVSRYSLKAKMGERDIDAQGLETLLLLKGADGWKIRHSHTSSRPVRKPPAQ